MLTREMLTPYTELLLHHDLFEGIPPEALPVLVQELGGELRSFEAFISKIPAAARISGDSR
mgnify:CR=1 FL=1